MRLFLPCDSAAVAVGADDVHAALAGELARRGIGAEVVRTGSRGLFELEPLLEAEVEGVRVGFGRVAADQVAGIVAALIEGGMHDSALGPVEDIPFLKKQSRLTFARCGIVDPLSLADYRAQGGLAPSR